MTTVEEMKKCLAKEYGITSYEQLEKELKKMGGIPIGVFVDKVPNRKDNQECKSDERNN